MTPQNGSGHFLVCHDLVVGALPKRPNRQSDLCISNCRRLLIHARTSSWTIAHSYSDERIQPIDRLEPLPSEPVLDRRGASAFSNRSFLRLVGQLSTYRMVVVGCSLGAACLPTILTASDLGISTILVTDAVAQRDEDASSASVLQIIRSVGAHRWAQLQYTRDVLSSDRPSLRLVVDQ